MDCKFAVVAFCLFSVGYVDATTYDVWDLLSGNDDRFYLVSRSYSRDNNECAYMKRKSQDDGNHELQTEMSHRKAGHESFEAPSTYTVTVKGSEMTVRAQTGSEGVTYELVYSDGNGCNILKGKTAHVTDKCELWAPPQKVEHAQEVACSKKFEELCKEVKETPYNEGCQIPETGN
uniref:Putative salivary secreted lipocalin n=1 Tax=Ornithodoros turicata TaxID=34597 RepID=A0A2R5L995_9ACAR